MQRTPNLSETQDTPSTQQAVLPVGPQVLDPSMFKFVSGGLPRDGGWAIVATEPATATPST